MSSIEDRVKRSRRLKRKTKEKLASPIAKELRTRKYKMQVITDKRGKKIDLKKLTHLDLVHAIQEDED